MGLEGPVRLQSPGEVRLAELCTRLDFVRILTAPSDEAEQERQGQSLRRAAGFGVKQH